MKIRYSYLILSALIVVSVIIAYDAFTSYIDPYLHVSDIARNNAAYLDKEVQVLGRVANGSSTWAEDGSLVFDLTEGEDTIKVIYDGSPPQNFQEDQEVVVIGKLSSPSQLNASEMLVKCPSKYEGGETSIFSDPMLLIAIILGIGALIYYVVFILLKKS